MDQFQINPWLTILKETRENAVTLPLKDKKMIIFSDLHMGNGGSRDDFRRNAQSLYSILSGYYYPGNYHLVLNGDIEELQKFKYSQIREKWASHYNLFEDFYKENRFTKILGNHDLFLKDMTEDFPYPISESLELKTGNGSILIYHGHQFSDLLMRFDKLCRFTLQYLAYPLGIMNHSKSPTSRKKLKTELRAYESSSREGIISIIGHTHRPLFESMSKADSLRYRLDSLIRSYRKCVDFEKPTIVNEIKNVQKELSLLKNNPELHISELYSSEGLQPCLFNSGCTIGKRGITAIELDKDKIKLVYWYDSNKMSQYQNFYGYKQTKLQGTSLRKVVLNSEKLCYIQDKIRFTGPQPFPSVTDTALSFQPLPN
jgi:UDP-2,3-diacylglucosamine pyrophosphatase LpxH